MRRALTSIATIAAAVVPAAALAAQVETPTGDRIVYSAAPGETNRVRAGAPPGIAGQLRLSDPGTEITLAESAATCALESPSGFLCPDGFIFFVAILRDGDDVFVAGASIAGFSVRGGEGQDVIRNAAQASGNAGDDTLVAPGSKSRLEGDAGDDTLNGYLADDRLDGGAGADRIRGGGGADSARGGMGDDVIDGGPDKDDIRGGQGEDTLGVGAGAGNFADGGGGRDTINARNGKKDKINCGSGRGDVATVDRVDRTRNCERVRIR